MLALGLVSLIAVLGCPAKKPAGVPSGPASSRPAAPTRAPVAQLVPPGATYAVVARNVTGVIEAVRQWVEPLRIVDTEITVANLEQALRTALGLSPLDINDLDDAGIDVEGGATLFSVGIAPTLVLPVADAQRLRAFFEAREKKITVRVRDRRGLAVTSWDLTPGLRASRALLDGHLALHLDLQRPAAGGDADLRWVDALVAAQSATRSSQQITQLLEALPEHRDVVLFVSPARVDAASRALYAKGCRGAAAETVRTIRGGMRLAGRRASLRLSLELGAATRRALGAAPGSPPPRLPAALWDPAPARLQLDLPRAFLRQPPAGCAGPGATAGPGPCGVVCDLSRQLVDALGPLVRASWIERAGGKLAGVLLAADQRGQLNSVRGALVAALPDAAAERFFRSELRVKPGASTRVHGKAVEELAPTVELRESARASFADGLLRLAAGDGLLDELLAPRDPPAATAGRPRTLLSFALRPAGLADLRVPLKLLGSEPTAAHGRLLALLGGTHGYSPQDKVAHLASSCSAASLDVTLTPAGIEVRAELELR